MENNKITLLEDRLIEFGVSCAMLCEKLPRSKFGLNMEDQLSRSATSPALNYGEAQAAESRKDFIHKMKICLKELRESRASLKLIKRYYERNEKELKGLQELIAESGELIAIFTSSINTARKNAA